MKALASSEFAVMDLLWTTAPLTAREIRERLYPDAQKKQHGTVQRLLQRLEEKGLVVADRSSHSHTFAPNLTREAYAAAQMGEIVKGLSDNAIGPTLTCFIENRRIPKDEIQRLRELLDKMEREDKSDD